jgi:hypothetical protein
MFVFWRIGWHRYDHARPPEEGPASVEPGLPPNGIDSIQHRVDTLPFDPFDPLEAFACRRPGSVGTSQEIA